MTTNLPALTNKDYRVSLPSEHEMMVYTTMAKQAVDSKMYKGIGDEAAIMMRMLAARELGIPPMQALNKGLHIINGMVEISARMMGALIRKAGHQFITKESSENLCTIIGKRTDTNETQECTFTFAEAEKAGLVKPGSGWIKWPKDMCYARALSRLARQLFQDIIGIGYVEGEIVANEEPLTLPGEVFIEVEDKKESVETLSERFLSWFEKSDHLLLGEYLDSVMKHFGWDKRKTLEEFLKDEENLKKKFQAWKNKHKIT